mmetsp:Transcript_8512/g.15404  ORF Transcript_8512/g.15404 Transcript_8512/m.15404 type:complete len:647 (-) Transcript_8512:718-2658(-)
MGDNVENKKGGGGGLGLFKKFKNKGIETLDVVNPFGRKSVSGAPQRNSEDSRKARLSLGQQSSDRKTSDGSNNTVTAPRFSYALDDIPASVGSKNFKELLHSAKNGSISVVTLLEAMFLLEENLPGDVYVQLFKYLSRLENLKIMVKLLTTVVPEEMARDKSVDDVRLRDRSPYVVSMVLSSGPYQIRRVLALNPQLVEQLLKYFESDTILDSISTVRVSRVVFAMLNDNPQDTVKLMAKRRSFIPNLVKRLYSVPVAELVPQIFATGQPDSLSTLRFGPCNIEGVPLLADARVYDLIAEEFERAEQSRQTEEDYLNVSLIENSAKCVSAITMRAMATVPFEKENCNFDRNFMKRLNMSLDALNVFHSPSSLMKMLDVGLQAASKDSNRRSLRAVVNVIIDILFAYHSGSKSSAIMVRKAVQSVNLDPFEDELGKRIPALTALLRETLDSSAPKVQERSTAQLGSVKLKIIEMLVFLFAFQTSDTVKQLIASRTPQTLFELFLKYDWNNMLQNLLAMSIEASLIGRNTDLKIVWLREVELMDQVTKLWEYAKESDSATPNQIAYRGWVVRVARALNTFVSRNKSNETGIDVEELVGSNVLERFLKIPVADIEKTTKLERVPLGGVDVPKRTVSILRNLAPSEQVLI